MPYSGILGLRSARSVGLRPRSHASLRHIFAALALLRKPLFGLQKRRVPRTLSEKKPGVLYKF